VRKSLGGTGGPRGTARPRSQSPGAASDRARRSVVTGESRERTLADGAAAKRQVGPIGIDEVPTRAGRDQHCEGHKRTPRASPTSQKEIGQAAITARTAGPVRAPKERRPRMTRAGGVSTNTRSKQTETRGAKNRKGEFEQPARCRRGRRTFTGLEPTPQRDGPEAGRLRDGTARPANAEGTRIAKPHERWPIDLSAASAAGGKSTGPVDDGGPASAPRRVPKSERGQRDADRGTRQREPKRARTLRRAPRRTDGRGRTRR